MHGTGNVFEASVGKLLSNSQQTWKFHNSAMLPWGQFGSRVRSRLNVSSATLRLFRPKAMAPFSRIHAVQWVKEMRMRSALPFPIVRIGPRPQGSAALRPQERALDVISEEAQF